MLKTLDPYTEYQNFNDAVAMQESVTGKYGGVGLIISGGKDSRSVDNSDPAAMETPLKSTSSSPSSSSPSPNSQPSASQSNEDCSDINKNRYCGVTVVDAFENFAYDYGLRIGDRIMSIDGNDVMKFSADQVKSLLRGDPNTSIMITVHREGVKDDLAFMVKREVVKMSDVKLASFLGNPEDGIGYINLHGFNADAGTDFKNALITLRYNSKAGDLKGLLIDLRGNPGGLLQEAVEISSYLLPPDTDVVSSKTRTGEEIIYKSSKSPIRPNLGSTGLPIPVVILVNQGSASASEIVSGALQDYDAAVIVGPTRTFGKGLVQKIVPLPYNSALKYTMARYYTPSGRCIQSINYNGGRASGDGSTPSSSSTPSISTNGRTMLSTDLSSVVKESERKTFSTQHGRQVRDGGGIEPDVIVDKIHIGPAEEMLVNDNLFFRFAGEYLQNHPDLLSQLERQSYKNVIGEKMIAGTDYMALEPASVWKGLEDRDMNKIFTEFERYVEKKMASGEVRPSFSYQKEISALQDAFKSGGLTDSAKEVDALEADIAREIMEDLRTNKKFIKEDLVFAIGSRVFPSRLMIQRTVELDPQVAKGIEIVKNPEAYWKMLIKRPALQQVRGTGTGPVIDAVYD